MNRTNIQMHLRRFSASSIVEAAMRLLWAEYPNKLDALQTAPWHILLLVKWSLQDKHIHLRVGRRIQSEEFDVCRQMVRDLVGQEYLASKPPIWLMLRAHMPQFDFQRPEGWGFLRWPALIAREPAEHRSRRQFIEQIGLSPEHFMDLTYGIMAAVTLCKLPIKPNWYEPVRHYYGASVDHYIRLIALDLPALRDQLQSDAKQQKLPLRQELYEFPYLKRYPFFKARNGFLYAWHPMVAARGLEEIVHLRLSRLGEQYTRPFSRLFERYVWELAQSMSSKTITEEEFENRAGQQASKVEAIIPLHGANVLIEAKMALFADDVLLTDNANQAHHKTKRVRDGIKQAWNVSKALRADNSLFPQCARAQHDYLLLVTSRELGLGSGDKLRRLFAPGMLDYPDDDCRKWLPLENVFIMGILDYERLSVAVASNSVPLLDLLKEAVEKNRNPATSAILFDSFLAPYVKNWGSTDLLRQAHRDSRRRLGESFGQTPEELQADGEDI